MADRRARWGLLSTARINERLIPCLRRSERNELIGVASRRRDTANRYAEEHEISKAYGSYEEILADPAIDVVYISLPNGLHTEWSLRCAEAGKHVLCEKPLALSVEEVDQLLEAADRCGVTIQEATMMRFHSQTSYVRSLIAQGAIGEVRMGRGLFTFTLERPGDIRLDPAMGGGSVWDLGSYCVSFVRTVLQAEPLEVHAVQTTGPTGIDMSFSGHLKFSSGAFFHFFSSFASFAQVDADLLGTAGYLHLDLPWLNRENQPASVRLVRQAGAKEASTFGDGLGDRRSERRVFAEINAYQDEVESMAATVLDGADPVVTLQDSRANVAAITALCRSAREGRPVVL